MKLFLYYVFCAVKNQIRKLFKTWVAIFLLVCMLIGGVIGGIAASLDSMVEDELPPEDVEMVEPSEDELPPEDDAISSMSEEEIMRIAEAVIAGLLLLLVVMEVLGAEKNGSNIFMMADVNLLFASPMRPQSVLMFRLCAQMGAMIFLGIYLLLAYPFNTKIQRI